MVIIIITFIIIIIIIIININIAITIFIIIELTHNKTILENTVETSHNQSSLRFQEPFSIF